MKYDLKFMLGQIGGFYIILAVPWRPLGTYLTEHIHIQSSREGKSNGLGLSRPALRLTASPVLNSKPCNLICPTNAFNFIERE